MQNNCLPTSINKLINSADSADHRPNVEIFAVPTHSDRLRRRRIGAVIPQPSDQVAHRNRQGSPGRRPPAFDAEDYQAPNVIERSFNTVKQWRSLATRYDKPAVIYPAQLQSCAPSPSRCTIYQTRPSRTALALAFSSYLLAIAPSFPQERVHETRDDSLWARRPV
jgi:hypothetical protein